MSPEIENNCINKKCNDSLRNCRYELQNTYFEVQSNPHLWNLWKHFWTAHMCKECRVKYTGADVCAES